MAPVEGIKLRFLIDTGASISLIKYACVPRHIELDTSQTIKLNGVNGVIDNRGCVFLQMLFGTFNIKQRFVVIDSIECQVDGIIGVDLLSRVNALIDFSEQCIKIHGHDDVIYMDSVNTVSIRIPPRCEKIFEVEVGDIGDSVILQREITGGVFVAGMIVSPNDGKVNVRLLNINDHEVVLHNFIPETRRMNEFVYVNSGDSRGYDEKRINALMQSISLNHLDQRERDSIEDILKRFHDVFHLDGDKLTTTDLMKQTIHIKPECQPVYVKPYRLPHSQKTEIKAQITSMLDNNIIEEATSEWNSPVLLVPKKDDNNGNKKWRLVIDYRKVNKQIQDDKFPLPNINDILDSLGKAVYFTALDLSQGYYQLEIDDNSKPITAFSVPGLGQFQMTKLPMGLKISPSAFSRMMTIAMSGLNYNKCFVYLDDLIVFGSDLLEHNKNLNSVLLKLRYANLKLNTQKCHFLQRNLIYLGHKISDKGIEPDYSKIEVIKSFPVPNSVEDVKRFVAMANYYRRHIKDFAQISCPLNKLTRKGVVFNWNEECQDAFDSLKRAMASDLVLDYPNFSDDNQFQLTTDASGLALGAVLSNSNSRPIAYASRCLNKPELNYSTIEKELLAVVCAVRHFRPYLYGRKFTIYTDHRPLVYLFSMIDPSSRLTKFRLALEEYDFDVVYIKGCDNVVADALSRIDISLLKNANDYVNVTTRSMTKSRTSSENDKHSATQPAVVEVLKAQRKTTWILFKSNPNYLSGVSTSTPISVFSESIITVNDPVPVLRTAGASIHKAVVKVDDPVPVLRTAGDSIRKTVNILDDPVPVLRTAGDSIPISGTQLDMSSVAREIYDIVLRSGAKTVTLLKNQKSIEFIKTFKSLFKDCDVTFNVVREQCLVLDPIQQGVILYDYHNLPSGGHLGINRMYLTIQKKYAWPGLYNDVVQFVSKCLECKKCKVQKHIKAPLKITSTATEAFETVYVDLVGPLPVDSNGYKYVLTLQCELSKFIEAYPLKDKVSESVASALVNQFILRYGVPRCIVSDLGKEFVSELFDKVCKLLEIDRRTSAPYHHETIGALENSHKHLGSFLKIQLLKQDKEWPEWLPFWSFSHNNTVHSATGYAPAELVFGKITNIPSNLGVTIDPIYNFDSYISELKYRLNLSLADARTNLLESKGKSKVNYDKRMYVPKLPTVGDKVLVLNNARKNKTEPYYSGPYSVTKVELPNIYILYKGQNKMIHLNNTKLI